MICMCLVMAWAKNLSEAMALSGISHIGAAAESAVDHRTPIDHVDVYRVPIDVTAPRRHIVVPNRAPDPQGLAHLQPEGLQPVQHTIRCARDYASSRSRHTARTALRSSA